MPEDPRAPAEESGPDGDPTDAAAPFPGAAHVPDAPSEEGTDGPTPMLEASGLEKRYGQQRALGPVTLELPHGCVGLLGPNGAGKSTLIRVMMGLLPPSAGTLRVLGEGVRAGSKDVRRRIGYVPEGEAQFPDLNGLQSVVLAGRLAGMPRPAAMQRAHQVLDYVGLGEARYRFAGKYSTGMRQRLKLAQALVHDPELLILDEPTEGVDPESREEILELILELHRVHGIQILLSTHLLHDVERIAEHAVVLNEGRVAAHGPLEDLQRPQSAGFLVRVDGSAADLEARLREAGVAFRAEPPALRVDLADARAVLRHVHGAGLTVRHLAPVRLSLTDAFEHAVSGGGADA